MRKRIWEEARHPRDDRGRFSRTGGASWVNRLLSSGPYNPLAGPLGNERVGYATSVDPAFDAAVRRASEGPTLPPVKRLMSGNTSNNGFIAAAQHTSVADWSKLSQSDRDRARTLLEPRATSATSLGTRQMAREALQNLDMSEGVAPRPDTSRRPGSASPTTGRVVSTDAALAARLDALLESPETRMRRHLYSGGDNTAFNNAAAEMSTEQWKNTPSSVRATARQRLEGKVADPRATVADRETANSALSALNRAERGHRMAVEIGIPVKVNGKTIRRATIYQDGHAEYASGDTVIKIPAGGFTRAPAPVKTTRPKKTAAQRSTPAIPEVGRIVGPGGNPRMAVGIGIPVKIGNKKIMRATIYQDGHAEYASGDKVVKIPVGGFTQMSAEEVAAHRATRVRVTPAGNLRSTLNRRDNNSSEFRRAASAMSIQQWGALPAVERKTARTQLQAQKDNPQLTAAQRRAANTALGRLERAEQIARAR